MKRSYTGRLAFLMALLLSLTMVLAACGQSEESAPAEEPAEAEETAEVPTVSGTVKTDIDMTGYEAGKVVRVWVPVGQQNEDQEVEEAVIDAGDAKAEITTDANGNKMAYIEWAADADPASRKASVSFHAKRSEIKIAPEDMKEEGEVGDDMAEYLTGSKMVVVDGVVKEQADEITANETTVLGKARAIYDWVYENFERDNDVVGCGQGDVCELLVTRGGKCTDINSVFVALCRASGIPAREMFGIRMNDADITGNQHCWAQFYLPGTGWIYADPADVLKAVLTNEWEKTDAEALETKEYYWGGVDEKRVELSRGRDLTLSPAQDAGELNDFGYPYAEVDGEIVDFYHPADFVYTISFTED